MSKRIASLVLVSVVLLALAPAPAHTSPTHEIVYTVWWEASCPVSPQPPEDFIVGEWTRGCNNQWYGWGWEPYTYNCTYTTVSQGEEC